MSLSIAAAALRLGSSRRLVAELLVGAIALVLAVLFALSIIEDEPAGFKLAGLGVTLALIVPALITLLGRRRWPISVLAISTILFCTIRLAAVPELQISSLAIVAAFFSAGRWGRAPWRDWARAIATLAFVGLLVYDVVKTWGDLDLYGVSERVFLLSTIGGIAANVVLFVLTWLAGDASRRRDERERELAVRTLELEASREENARRAVMDERVRIAREIHDVVAHHVSVMGLHAGAARRLTEAGNHDIEEPLRAIEDSSRDAVGELHRLLGFLRHNDEVDPDSLAPEALAPTPGLHRLPDLRAQLASAGLALRLSVTGEERPLPPGVDLNAYRILQEALTNCLKYAGVDHAEVCIHYGSDELSLSVIDDGRGPSAHAGNSPTTSTGTGLAGMAERVALVGGLLHHGPRAEGGFEVRASLPIKRLAPASDRR